MDKFIKKPPLWYGIIVGAVATPALMAVMFLGERFAGMPFVPFDFFNWIARILPGALITFGIDSMVDTLIAVGLGANLDDAAKTAERIMALTIFWGIGVLASTAFFALMNRLSKRDFSNIPAFVFAALFGLPFIAIVANVNITSAAPFYMQWTWLGMLYLGYGVAVNWAYMSLAASLATELTSSRPEVEGINRRQFIIRFGGASATITLIGAGLGQAFGFSDEPSPVTGDAVASAGLIPNAEEGLQPAKGTRLEVTPVENHYRIDILSGGLPNIPTDYKLPITGLVANPVQWSLDEIKAMPSITEYITMSCISNRVGGSLISTTKWTGVSFQQILEQVQPDESAVALKIIGVDNFDEYVSLDLIRADERIMLTYAWDDADLPLRNGYPLRIHIPNHYGMKQPKWIQSIELVSSEERGYWVRRGWSEQAIVNATSVVDTIADDAVYQDENGQWLVPMGGIAWAGDREIVRVEVRVDNGAWVEAQLRDTLSDRTWRIWRYDWAFQEGTHNIEVRCYEANPDAQGDAILQPTETRGTRPDGATGIHSKQEILRALETESAEG